ncbi:dermonecrotic toxin domain-containing protein [Pseudomonas sp. UBA4194]|uniref:dermonecrotic toxin domain-containing protein n=1 Tax=Pseudomonas sp. UBA4194 TaxID=1947317 RepID=UPI0025D2093C|nr:DUF6543 domain-containing protein [Pseudomonas sp. UBA4194]
MHDALDDFIHTTQRSNPASVSPTPERLDASLQLTATTELAAVRHTAGQLLAAAPGLLQMRQLAPAPDNVADAFKQRWIDYWNERAAATALSHREHFADQYARHLQACAQLAYATGRLSAVQLKPVWRLFESPLGPHRLGSHTLYVESLALALTDGKRARLPGALLFTLDGEAPTEQLLYVPGEHPALRHFTSRADLEGTLSGQIARLWPGIEHPSDIRLHYEVKDDPLDSAPRQLLSHCRVAVLEALGAEPSEHDDHLDTELRQQHLQLLNEQHVVSVDSGPESLAPITFGQLHADIALEQRAAEVMRQRRAMEQWLGADYAGDAEHPRWRSLSGLLQSLNQARLAAQASLDDLLAIDAGQSLTELRTQPNAHYSALQAAHVAALRAETEIQHSLGQLEADDAALLRAVLDPDPQNVDTLVAGLSLAYHQRLPTGESTRSDTLGGWLLICRPAAIDADAPSGAVLLYSLGIQGGLHRFASLADLKTWLLDLAEHDDDVRLSIKQQAAQAIGHSLEQLLLGCETRAAALLERYPGEQHKRRRSAELERLREDTLAQLHVPIPAARTLAYAQLLEQNQTSALSQRQPSWLLHLDDTQRGRYKALYQAYISAMQRSAQVLARHLPARAAYARAQVQARLSKDFTLHEPYQISLDLPARMEQRKELVTGSGSPGTPFKLIKVPSAEREVISLEELALGNVDPDMAERLGHMSVQIRGGQTANHERLQQGLSKPYLSRLVSELDLAADYERKIRASFLGTPDEAGFTFAFRRESLLEPIRLMLQLQVIQARHEDPFEQAAYDIVQTAIDADSSAAWQPEGRRIQLKPVALKPLGAHGVASTLAGITLIHEQVSATTFLYIPDSPDHRSLRRYDSQALAMDGLGQLLNNEKMLAHIAERALLGDTTVHQARLREARLRDFDPFEVGTPWPATTSLANHLLNTHMGRLIEAHRLTARSNDHLFLERFALDSGQVFNYVRMALGMLPFVGSAVALYDAWDSANKAVAAFRQADVGNGLDDLQQVLQCLIDATMDVLPGNVVRGSGAIRRLTGQRQARQLRHTPGALRSLTPARTKAVRADAFAGYEHAGVVDLWGRQAGRYGLYRHVYSLPEGHFIMRQGRAYKVELQGEPPLWYLSATARKQVRQAITLDEADQWNTHFAVYGRAHNGGLAGGGNTLGHLLDSAEPHWPQAIRQYLPRWLIDRVVHRREALKSRIDTAIEALNHRNLASAEILERYRSSGTGREAAEAVCERDVREGQALYADLQRQAPYLDRRNKARNLEQQGQVAETVCKRLIEQIEHLEMRYNALQEQIRSNIAPGTFVAYSARQLQQRQANYRQSLALLDEIDPLVELAGSWNQRMIGSEQKAITALLARVRKVSQRDIFQASLVSLLLHAASPLDDIPGLFHLREMCESLTPFHNALQSQKTIGEVQASVAQLKQVLESTIASYRHYKRQLELLSRLRPEYFDAQLLPRMAQTLDALIAKARQSIAGLKAGSAAPRPRGDGPSRRRVFETADGQHLIGEEFAATPLLPRRFRTQGPGGHWEVWVEAPGNRWRMDEALPAPAASQPNLQRLIEESRQLLLGTDAQVTRIEGYASVSAQDIEDMLGMQARQLDMRADDIAERAADSSVVQELRARAKALRQRGRLQHIQTRLRRQQPEAGDLDYLLEQGSVEVVKQGGVRELDPYPGGGKDFLLEFEVRDITGDTPRPLWYVHFHYRTDTPTLDNFAKAHIKTAEQRYLGMKWQQAQKDGAPAIHRGDINKAMVHKHFRRLFE